MRKIASIITLLTVFNVLTFGQTDSNKSKVIWGESIERSNTSIIENIAVSDQSGIYVLKRNRKKLKDFYVIEFYDNDLNLKKSEIISEEEQNKKMIILGIFSLNHKLYLLSSFSNNKLRKRFLFAQSINKETLMKENDIKKIADTDYSAMNQYNNGSFSYMYSPDSTRFLIYAEKQQTNAEKEDIGLFVLDKELKKVWSKKIVIPHKRDSFDIEDFYIDNYGDVHLLGIQFNDIRYYKRDGTPNYKYRILSYRENGDILKQYPIEIENKFITDMKIAINSEQNIICAGLYSLEGSYNIEGCFSLIINKNTNEMISKDIQKFDDGFITHKMTEKQEGELMKKDNIWHNKNINKYNLEDIKFKSDGSAFLICEHYYEQTIYHDRSSTTYYNYNDIIVINISPSGKIEWKEKISKEQRTRNDVGHFSSYTHSIYNNKLYLVYNDNPKNLLYKDGDKLHQFNNNKETNTVLINIDANGKQTKVELSSFAKNNVIITPHIHKHTNKNGLIIYSSNKGIYRFMKLSFKK